jgi:hypothetical protein
MDPNVGNKNARVMWDKRNPAFGLLVMVVSERAEKSYSFVQAARSLGLALNTIACSEQAI